MDVLSSRTVSFRRPGRHSPWKLSKRHMMWCGMAFFVLFSVIEFVMLQSHHQRNIDSIIQNDRSKSPPGMDNRNAAQQQQAATTQKQEQPHIAKTPQLRKNNPDSQTGTRNKEGEPKVAPNISARNNASPDQKHLAIVIPFRESKDLRSQGIDREKNLRQWLDYMSDFLRPELIAVTTIYIIEQTQEGIFNKGFLFNAGFDYIMKSSAPPNYLIFHDVDQIPRKTCSSCYDYRSSPTKLIRETTRQEGNKTVKRKLSPSNVGGALMMTPDIYRKVNGYSNILAGWGIEDDNMGYRIKRFNGGFRVLSPGAFTGLPHARVPGLDTTEQFRKNTANAQDTETGLSTLQYQVSDETEALVKKLNVVRVLVEPVGI